MNDDAISLPTGWVMTTVDRVGTLRVGKQRTPRSSGQGLATKYLRSANILSDGSLDLSDLLEMDFSSDEREIYKLRPGDLLLVEASGSTESVGRSAVWQNEVADCCYQNHLIRFRPHCVLPAYALAVFRQLADSGAFVDASRGIGIQHLGLSRLSKMAFPLPPLAEQARIVAEIERQVAEASEAEAALRSALARTFEQDAAILEAAVSGRLVEQEASLADREKRKFESASDLLRRTAPEATADPAYESGESKAVPSGWELPTLEEVGEVRLGRQRAPKYDHGSNPTPYIRAANIVAEGLDLSDVLQMEFTPDEQRTYELLPGDVVLSEASGSSAQVGKSAIWRGEIPGCCFQNTVVRFRPRACSPEYALIVFRHFRESGTFGQIARGVGIQHLGASRLAATRFPLPPVKEQTRIVQAVETRTAASLMQREVTTKSLNQLEALRRSIWATAIAGRLVLQEATDERAELLLERMGEPFEVRLPRTPRKREDPVTSKAPRVRKGTRVRSIASTLAEAARPLPLTELFSLCGYDRDSTIDVERFYIALRAEVGKTAIVVDGKVENAVLEQRNAS